MKRILVLTFIIIAFVLAGCQTTGTKKDGSKPVAKKARKKAEKKSKDSKGTIYVIIDTMDPAKLSKSQLRSQKDLIKYMRRDMKKRFRKKGKLDVIHIAKPSEFRKGKKSYLLRVKILKYVRGSTAARVFGGFGGIMFLDIKYTLKNRSGKTIINKRDSVKAASGWQALPKRLNVNMLREIKVKVY
jgi:hypothetical protein